MDKTEGQPGEATNPSIDELVQVKLDELPKTEVSAITLARMAGLATSREVKVLEGKLDLISGRLSNLAVRLDRALTMLNNIPTGADFERIDVQLGNLKTTIKEALASVAPDDERGEEAEVTKDKLDSFLSRHSKKGTGMADDGGDSGAE
jgi:hypothetical protein